MFLNELFDKLVKLVRLRGNVEVISIERDECKEDLFISYYNNVRGIEKIYFKDLQ